MQVLVASLKLKTCTESDVFDVAVPSPHLRPIPVGIEAVASCAKDVCPRQMTSNMSRTKLVRGYNIVFIKVDLRRYQSGKGLFQYFT